ESKDLRRSIGTAAYDDVRRNHTTKARAPLLEQALATLTPQRGADERLSINWLTDANRSTELLAESRHDVRVYGEGRYADLAAADVSIATDLRSAQAVAAHGSSLFKWFLISTVDEGRAAEHLPLRPVTASQLEQLLSTSCFVALGGESRARPRS